jgi:putative addiction module component (TIGR02574 family)
MGDYMVTKSLENDILNLDPNDKIQLIQLIFDSLKQISPEIDKAWAEESEKRIDAYQSGTLKASDWDDVKKKYDS